MPVLLASLNRSRSEEQDISRAFLAVLGAPREAIHNQAFNVGSSQENYQIRDVAAMVEGIVPGSRVKYAQGGGPDLRCYRVNCDKIAQTLSDFQPQWTVRRGIEQLYAAYKDQLLTLHEFTGTRFVRIKHLSSLLESSRLAPSLRWAL